jgi:hypothetical protein
LLRKNRAIRSTLFACGKKYFHCYPLRSGRLGASPFSGGLAQNPPAAVF